MSNGKGKEKLKRISKWLVPKFTGIFILALGAIQNKGRLPETTNDWVMFATGVGLAFASNSLHNKNTEKDEHAESTGSR